MKVYVITEEISLGFDNDSVSIIAVCNSKEKAIYYIDKYVKNGGYTITYRGEWCINCKNDYQYSSLNIEEFEVE